MEKDKKQVIMSYEEHEQLLKEREELVNELIKTRKVAREVSINCEKALKAKGVLFVENARVQIGYELRGNVFGRATREPKYLEYTKIVPYGDVVDRFNESNQELHLQINNLRADVSAMDNKLREMNRAYNLMVYGVKEFLDSLPKRFRKRYPKYFQI